MNLIKNENLKEELYEFELENGVRVYYFPKKDLQRNMPYLRLIMVQ